MSSSTPQHTRRFQDQRLSTQHDVFGRNYLDTHRCLNDRNCPLERPVVQNLKYLSVILSVIPSVPGSVEPRRRRWIRWAPSMGPCPAAGARAAGAGTAPAVVGSGAGTAAGLACTPRRSCLPKQKRVRWSNSYGATVGGRVGKSLGGRLVNRWVTMPHVSLGARWWRAPLDGLGRPNVSGSPPDVRRIAAARRSESRGAGKRQLSERSRPPPSPAIDAPGVKWPSRSAHQLLPTAAQRTSNPSCRDAQ